MIDPRTSYEIVPVVAPATHRENPGQVKNLHVYPGITHGMLVDDEGWCVRPAAAKQGWVLLETLYGDENNLDGWRRYQDYMRDWQAGRTLSSFPERLLPAAVLERRKSKLTVATDPWAEGEPAKPSRKPSKASKRAENDAASEG